MATKAKSAIPHGLRTITASITVDSCEQAIAWYKKALGAEEVSPPSKGPDGMIWHAELRIGDSVFMLNDPLMGAKGPKALGGTACTLIIYVDDCDALFDRAVKAGGKPTMPMSDMFWGDRWGNVVDPYGHNWAIATRKEDMTPAEMAERAKAFHAQMAQHHKK